MDHETSSAALTLDADNDSGNDLDALLTRINQLASGQTAKTPAPDTAHTPPKAHPALKEKQADQDPDGGWQPLEPESLAQAGVSEGQLEHLALRCLAALGDQSGHELADHHAVPFRL